MSRDPQPGRRAHRLLSRYLLRTFPGEKLAPFPPIVVLAREAGVGYTTMWKAVRELRDQGALLVKPHVGICNAGTSAHLPPPPARRLIVQSRAEQLAGLIAREIVTGRHPRNAPLPGSGELCVRYRASSRSVRAALTQLSSEGIIERAGRVYVQSRTARFGANARVVLVLRGDDLGRINLLTDRSPVLLRTIEEACSHAKLTLHIQTHYFRGTRWQGIDALRTLAEGDDGRGPVVGFIVWDMGLNMSLLSSILPILSRCGKPVAVLDEMGWEEQISTHLTGRLSCLFSMATRRHDGERVARRLYERGHRHFAYFSLRHEASAGEARLQGLRSFLDGYNDATLDVYHSDSETWDVVTRTRDEWLADRARGFLAEEFGLHGVVNNRAVQDITLALGRAQTLLRTRSALARAFDRALHDNRASVWVAFNDTIACVALELLKERGIGVPGRVSVAGFDNSQTAVAADLTSYEFGSTMYANATLNFILNPSGPRFRSLHRPVVFDGYLVERGSSRAI